MRDSFEAAVDWVEKASAFAFKRGNHSFPEVEPEWLFWQWKLEIYWVFETERTGRWIISDQSALRLLLESKKCHGAWQLAADVSAWFLRTNRDMPMSLRSFCAKALTGKIKKPATRRSRLSWSRNLLIITLVRRVHEDFGLNSTSGDATRVKQSACDAVAKGLGLNGFSITPAAIRTLVVSKGSKKYHDDYDRINQELQRIEREHPEQGDALLFPWHVEKEN